MTDATIIKTWWHKNWPVQVREFNVDGTTTDMIRLEIPAAQEEEFANHWDRVRCHIKRLIVSCDSASFDVHLFNRPDGVIDGLGQIWKSTGNNKWTVTPDSLIFVNREDPQDKYIYLKIVGGSGTIIIDLSVT